MELRRVRVDPTVKRRRLQLQLSLSSSPKHCDNKNDILPKFGFASVCGRRRDMEDAVASHPSFCRNFSDDDFSTGLHYFGVYDGHGCSHVN